MLGISKRLHEVDGHRSRTFRVGNNGTHYTIGRFMDFIDDIIVNTICCTC
jgi:hypothetical protein